MQRFGKNPHLISGLETIYMKKALGILISLAIIATASVSCKKDDTLRYNNATMGNVRDRLIISDQGNTFSVVEQNCPGDINEMDRVLLVCDVLKETAEAKYDVRLNVLTSVLTKVPVAAETIEEDSELAVEDPIIIQDLWYSGGYINMLIAMPVKRSSETKHLINLIYENKEEGKYDFTLRHNAYTEVPDEDTESEYVMGRGYVSFPIADLIKEDKAKIKISIKTYKTVGMGISLSEIEEVSKEYDWKRGGYEHAPKDIEAKSPMNIR